MAPEQGRARPTVPEHQAGWVDNRPQSIAQRRLQDEAARSPQAQRLGLLQAAAVAPKGVHPVQLFKIKGKGGRAGKDFQNLHAFKITKGKKHYDSILKSLQADLSKESSMDAKAVQSAMDDRLSYLYFGELYENMIFENEQHLQDQLRYDILNKAGADKSLSLQELYFTAHGWKHREKAAAAEAKQDGGAAAGAGKAQKGKPEAQPQAPTGVNQTLKAFRTMPLGAWRALKKKDYSAMADEEEETAGTGQKADYKELGRHLGDFKQAHSYLYRSGMGKVLVEFRLNPGAEKELFSPAHMAFPKQPSPTLARMMKILVKERGAFDQSASANEGLAAGKIGLKAEGGESGFSLGISRHKSPELFMSMVDVMKVIGTTADAKAEMGVEVPVAKPKVAKPVAGAAGAGADAKDAMDRVMDAAEALGETTDTAAEGSTTGAAASVGGTGATGSKDTGAS